MLKFMKGEPLDDEVSQKIKGRDALYFFSGSPMLGILKLEGVLKKEEDAFNDTFFIGYSAVNEIPILTFIFKKGIYECPITTLDEKNDDNTLFMVLVEGTGNIVMQNRMVSLDIRIIEKLREDLKKIENLSEVELYNRYLEVQNDFTSLQIFEQSQFKSKFKKI